MVVTTDQILRDLPRIIPVHAAASRRQLPGAMWIAWITVAPQTKTVRQFFLKGKYTISGNISHNAIEYDQN